MRVFWGWLGRRHDGRTPIIIWKVLHLHLRFMGCFCSSTEDDSGVQYGRVPPMKSRFLGLGAEDGYDESSIIIAVPWSSRESSLSITTGMSQTLLYASAKVFREEEENRGTCISCHFVDKLLVIQLLRVHSGRWGMCRGRHPVRTSLYGQGLQSLCVEAVLRSCSSVRSRLKGRTVFAVTLMKYTR